MWLKKLILFGIGSRLTFYMTRILVGSITKGCNLPSTDDVDQLEEECDSNYDRISKLPECIKEKILEYLPLKEMVRTCILSKGWRHTLCNVQDLYINFENQDSNYSQITTSSYEEDLKRIRFIDQVLNHHDGNVRILKIHGIKPDKEYFERWMLKLSNMQIKELILEFGCQRRWSRRPCLGNYLCAFKLFKDFDGFKQLQSLHLDVESKISDTDVTKLISCCPLLEELILEGFTTYHVLKIHAPKLRKLSIWSNFGDLYLETPKLLEVSVINTCLTTIATRGMIFGRNLIQALSSVSQIKYLYIYFWYPDSCIRSLPKGIPPIFNHLTKLFIYFNPSDAQMTLTLFLFRNTPNLQKLTLVLESSLSSSIPSAYEQLESCRHQLFSCLRDVVIFLDPGSDWAIALAKFILNKAPVLEVMTIWENIEDLEDAKSRELERLSVRAKIILKRMVTQFRRRD